MWEARRPATTQENPLANAQFSRFTDWEGTEGGAEISPDGKFVAFLADRDGRVRPLAEPGGHREFSQPHADIPPLQRTGSSCTDLRLFGRRRGDLVQSQAGDSSAPKMLMPLTGGTPRAFLGEGATAPSWSPDGTRLVYVTNGDGDPLFVADRTGADARPDRRRQPGLRERHAQPQSGLVTRRPVDLLRARTGADRRDGRVARSTLGRIAGATDRRSTPP